MANLGLQKNTFAAPSTWGVVASTLLLTMSLSACGKKGPLYLPENHADKPSDNVNISTQPADSQTTQQETP